MLFDDTYKTIEAPAEGIFRDRGSKFIALAFPISSEEDIKPLLAGIKAEHPKARHYCWAFRLSPDRSIFRINDDGEPSGTAGRPILNILLSLDVTNIFVVVVRYFGGTLLGVPGLINAYKTATQEAMRVATIIEKTLTDVYLISFDYLQMNEVMKLTKDENLKILRQEFDNNCLLELEVPKARVNQVIARFEKLGGVKLAYIKTV
ncbi:MAG: hypothetical protein K0S09_3307 [Sphingobacteriaceae bacterium]|jgi:uncharacterized YigZ family protein|nr:hypothetical protein [Sphingobacteriaceae bacterium]